MTLQQLEYILALEKYRQFGPAAEACNITQSTLSTMIKKLEDELDTVIFDRTKHPISPTIAGELLLQQARTVLFHANQLKEMSLNERQRISGTIHLAITPTIAPYIMPQLFKRINPIPEVQIHANEMHRSKIVEALLKAEVDMAIMSLPQGAEGLLEIPLYHETLYAYVSPDDPLFEQSSICSQTMPQERLWALRNEISFQKQIFEFCEQNFNPSSFYASGSLTTLIHIVNANSGFTIIPELHIPLLRDKFRENIRPLVDPVPMRQVSIFVREDYVREGLVNLVADTVRQIVPEHMIDQHLLKYRIKL